MNIFVLDDDPWLAARYHYDQHMNKMVVETAQLLSTCHRLHGVTSGIYEIAYPNHPCNVWVRESRENYQWTFELFLGLRAEREARGYGSHKTFDLIPALFAPPRGLESFGLTNFTLAMPDDCKDDDPVVAYRTYYLTEKNQMTWPEGRVPLWVSQ